MKEKDKPELPQFSIRLEDEDLQKKLEHIIALHPERRNPEDKETPYTWDEAGIADIFAEVYINEARYCPERKGWYVYKDEIWQPDDMKVAEKIKEFRTIMMVYAKYVLQEGDELREPYYKLYNVRMGDRRFRERVAKDAADSMAISADQFDANPYLINCTNGTYDLEKDCFREHRPEDLLTMQTKFSYVNHNPPHCDRFEKFIEEVTEGDRDKAKYLQKALGYSLLGISKEECMFILHGKTTRNGKSTLLDAICHMLGNYADVAPVELICKQERTKNPDSHTSQLAKLKGKRFVTMAESDTSSRLDESAIKQYTGGEMITARELYQKPISFRPQFTMWMSCNDLPSVRDKSIFASERLNVIEFNRHFSQEEQDKNLKTYFESPEAMRGIFTWLLDGYRMYCYKKLVKPASVRAAVKEYELDNDIVLQFLEERCEVTKDAADSIQAKDLYERYKLWCKTNGYFTCTVKKFNAEVTAHPEWYGDKSKTHGMIVYKGLRLKSKSV